MNSREVLTVRKHTYTDIHKQNNIQLWIFWLSRLQFSLPNGDSPPRDCFLRAQPGKRRLFNACDMVEAVDGWKSRNIFLRRFRCWDDFYAAYTTLYNKGRNFWRTNWCSLKAFCAPCKKWSKPKHQSSRRNEWRPKPALDIPPHSVQPPFVLVWHLQFM